MHAIASHQTPAPTLAMPAAARYATINQAAELRRHSQGPHCATSDSKRMTARIRVAKSSWANGTGPAGIWVQIGAKVLIDLDAFDRWIESHRTGGAQ